MSNEYYLIASYFIVGTVSLALAFVTYTLLRRSFFDLTHIVPGGKLGQLFRKVFLLGIILPTMAGFFSVTFRSCDKKTYETIISDQSYLIAKSQEQLSTSMSHMCIALLVWGLIVSIVFVTVGRKKKVDG